MLETEATVREIGHFGAGYCRLKLELRQEINVLPGQFAMLRPGAAVEPLLRRAMAFYDVCHKNGGTFADFIFHVIGRGTAALSRLRAGDVLEFLGPLGRPFDATAAREHTAVLVGGGVGTPALYLLAQELSQRAIPFRVFLGARTRADLIGVEDFSQLTDEVCVSTDDGSYGRQGFVTAPFKEYIERAETPHVVYTCGPDPMMALVSRISQACAVTCYASLEARMACGFGVCVGCVVETCRAGSSDYERVCVEGPVFDGREVVW